MNHSALFVRFFVRSYIKRTSQTSKGNATSKAAKDATHGIEREMHSTNGSANGKPQQNGTAKQENGGLSTTDPNKTEKSYADMMKH